MKRLVNKAMIMNVILIKIGVIPSISATIGAKIVTVLATTLQNPKTLAANCVGINLILAIYTMLKPEEIPNFAKEMNSGICRRFPF